MIAPALYSTEEPPSEVVYTPEELAVREARLVRKRAYMNTPEQKARRNAWRKKHPEKVRAWASKTREKNNAQLRKWCASHPEKVLEHRLRNASNVHARRLKKYNLTQQEYDSLVGQHQDRCAICHVPPTKKKSLVVDHHHGTGKVRALLCWRCNLRVGALETPLTCATLRYLCDHHPEFRTNLAAVFK